MEPNTTATLVSTKSASSKRGVSTLLQTFHKALLAKRVLTLFGFILVTFALSTLTDRPIYDINVAIDDKPPQEITELPYRNFDEGKQYVYRFTLDGVDHTYWRIIVDDKVNAIRVNGQTVDLSDIPPKALKDWKYGFQMGFAEHLISGQNHFEIITENFGGRAGFEVLSLGLGESGWLTQFLFTLGFVLCCIPLINAINGARAQAIFVAAIALIAYYNSYTGYLENTHDVKAHLEYIEFILTNGHPPPPHGGWEYHQPPLYYLIAAPLYAAGEKFTWLHKYELLQLMSNFCSAISLFFAYKIICINFTRPRLYGLVAFAIICFWPSGFIHASRIGNDALYYCLTIISLYFTLRWWNEKQNHLAYWAAFFIACTIMTKSNGLISIAVFGVLLLQHCISQNWPTPNFKTWPLYVFSCLILFAGVLVSLGDNVYYLFSEEKFNTLLGDSHNSLNGKLFVGNELRNYTIFDLQNFYEEPFAHPWSDIGGRQYFWNYLLKSSLWGEFIFTKDHHIKYAGITGMIYLALLLLVVRGGMLLARSKPYQPYFWLIFFSFVSLISFKIQSPASPHGDFRFIFPIILSLAVLYAKPMELASCGRLGKVSRTLIAMGFCASAAVFFAIPFQPYD